MDRFIHLGLAAAIQAVQDSGLPTGEALGDEKAVRIGVQHRLRHRRPADDRADALEMVNRGPRRISPFFVPASIINMISGHVSIKYGFKGPNIAVVTACTTGLHAIGLSARMIEYGDADVMIAGGAESTVSPLGIGGFAAPRALSTRNDDPATASRPWDKDRDGFVLGEGGGVLVLEEYEHAKARGAKIYAELGLRHERRRVPHDRARRRRPPPLDGHGAAQRRRQRRPGAVPQRARHLDAAGRPQRDQRGQARASAITRRRLVVNSTKSMTGHLLGGAGGIESVFTVLACTTRRARRPSTSSTRTPSATWTTAPTRRATEDRRRGEEQLRLRRHQRHAGVQARLSRALQPPAQRPIGELSGGALARAQPGPDGCRLGLGACRAGWRAICSIAPAGARCCWFSVSLAATGAAAAGLRGGAAGLHWDGLTGRWGPGGRAPRSAERLEVALDLQALLLVRLVRPGRPALAVARTARLPTAGTRCAPCGIFAPPSRRPAGVARPPSRLPLLRP
jgi:3-oxoacyl-(acyl-carrier-protein) synthase